MTVKSSPPFTALRAIEAAVRHRSYTWAARELAVTHSAVSQSIKRLEDELGTKLFERRGGAMEPSSAAVQLAEAYADAANVLSRSLERVTQSPLPERLVLAMPPSFGRLWLSPRLPRLSAAFPDLSIEVRTTFDAQAAEESHLVISVGPPPGEGWESEQLGDIILLPLCSPDFARRHHIERPADLTDVTLIAERDLPWRLWFQGVGQDAGTARTGHVFDDSSMMLDAAARGEGVALSQRLLAQSHLAAGTLIAPIAREVPAGQKLLVSWQKKEGGRMAVERFMRWLRAEMPFRRKRVSGAGSMAAR